MTEAFDKLIKQGLRDTHNSAIDAAAKMFLLCADRETTAEIANSILSLKMEAPDDDTRSPSSKGDSAS